MSSSGLWALGGELFWMIDIWGLPKFKATLSGGPFYQDYRILGSKLLWKLPFKGLGLFRVESGARAYGLG